MSWTRGYDEDADVVQNESLVDADATPLISLKTEGRLMEMRQSVKALKERGGLVCSVQNFEMRGKQWKFSCSCSSPLSGDFAVADDRGEVYTVSIEDNSYKMIRKAHAPVAAMCYIPCRNNQLLISYESGQVVLVDTKSNEVLANLQSEKSGCPPVRLMCAHPSKPIVVLTSDDACVSGKRFFCRVVVKSPSRRPHAFDFIRSH
jgi:hypothetical protein